MDLNKEIEFKDGVLKQTITILTSAPGLMFTGIIFFLTTVPGKSGPDFSMNDDLLELTVTSIAGLLIIKSLIDYFKNFHKKYNFSSSLKYTLLTAFVYTVATYITIYIYVAGYYIGVF